MGVAAYRETKKVKEQSIEVRGELEQILKRIEQVEARVTESEMRILTALESAKKAGWLQRLLGRF